ncbi:MAG: DUF4115 domain-containing protein [Anaerolineales bacterium]|nr:DUF4115 domain-containing protein [Anaerolineales bacterium]
MPESIGQRLKQMREARYLTLEKASDDTRIRVIFLQALEADDYSVIPSAAQGRGFLRNYAEYLGLNMDEMIADIQKNAPAPAEVSGPLPQVNLVETEIPPLTDSQDEKKAPPFWTVWFARRPKAESVTETESTLRQAQDNAEPVLEESPAPIAETEEMEQPKPHGRKKKKIEEEPPPPAEGTEIKAEAATLPLEIEQVEVKDEAKPGLISKLISFIHFRKKKELDTVPEIEEESAPAMESEIITPALPADVIFAEIGVQLRARRELISLTVEEVERHTRLRAVFVKALEAGLFDKLPSPVQTRGMLANYSTFLGLDADVILLRFADALLARRREKYAETPREKIQMEVVPSMPLLRTFIAGDLIFGLLMIVILVALAIWGVGRVASSQDDRNQIVQPAAPAIVDVLGDAPLPTASLELTFVAVADNPLVTSPAGEALTTPDAPTPGTNANVVVSVFAVERTFVRISVDGAVAFEGRMAPREMKVFEADNQVVVLTGNAAAIRVTYNGRDLGLMGGVGQVVSRVYLISGVVTPTATIPPTPTTTRTPLVTPTLTPTITPTVTPPDGG